MATTTARYADVRVGDPTFTTPDDPGDCPARNRDGLFCTLDLDHGPHHVAEGPTHVLAVWTDTECQ